MPTNLVLQGEGGILSLEVVSDNGWCHCQLEAGESIFLGADVIEHIASRLLGALGENDELAPVAGQIEGRDVRNALMLGEAHHALYVATDREERVLIWRHELNSLPIVGVIRLSPAQRHHWMSQIKGTCPGIWPSFQGGSYLDQKPAG